MDIPFLELVVVMVDRKQLLDAKSSRQQLGEPKNSLGSASTSYDKQCGSVSWLCVIVIMLGRPLL
jgi:hypothetical protein